MNQTVEIKSSACPHDMSAWCAEKMSSVVLSLAHIAEVVGAETITDSSQIIMNELSLALNDATKMLAFSCGAEWETTDRNIIINKGLLGYEELQVKYGLIRESAGQERIFEPARFISECRHLLAGKCGLNRTLMHELLNRVRFKKSPLLSALEEELETVTMGKIKWEAFVPCALDILAQIEKEGTQRPEA